MGLHMHTVKQKVYFSNKSNLLDKLFQLPKILMDTQ